MQFGCLEVVADVTRESLCSTTEEVLNLRMIHHSLAYGGGNNIKCYRVSAPNEFDLCGT